MSRELLSEGPDFIAHAWGRVRELRAARTPAPPKPVGRRMTVLPSAIVVGCTESRNLDRFERNRC